MGVGTDALLLYGVPLNDGSIDEYDDDRPTDIGDPYSLAHGINSSDGLTIQHHCSDEYMMHFLIIEGSRILAHRGYPKKVDLDKLNVPDDSDKRLLGYCERFKLRITGSPGWYLASYWG